MQRPVITTHAPASGGSPEHPDAIRCSRMAIVKDMSEIPLIDYANLDADTRARWAAIVAVHTSLERVLNRGREQRPPVGPPHHTHEHRFGGGHQ